MKTSKLIIQRQFLIRWVLWVSIAWPVGGILAIILSYTIVNLFYPEETNLIVGLVIGGTVGFAQWLVLKKLVKMSGWWILACAIGIGLPIIMASIQFEIIGNESGLIESEFLGRLILGVLGGLLTGLLQLKLLIPHSKKALWWIAINIVAWGLCFLLTASDSPLTMLLLLFGGVLLGAITGIGILWLLKIPTEETTV